MVVTNDCNIATDWDFCGGLGKYDVKMDKMIPFLRRLNKHVMSKYVEETKRYIDANLLLQKQRNAWRETCSRCIFKQRTSRSIRRKFEFF